MCSMDQNPAVGRLGAVAWPDPWLRGSVAWVSLKKYVRQLVFVGLFDPKTDHTNRLVIAGSVARGAAGAARGEEQDVFWGDHGRVAWRSGCGWRRSQFDPWKKDSRLLVDQFTRFRGSTYQKYIPNWPNS